MRQRVEEALAKLAARQNVLTPLTSTVKLYTNSTRATALVAEVVRPSKENTTTKANILDYTLITTMAEQ